jgi:hypothetical protein
MVYVQLEKQGFKMSNTLFADSTCPDEISHNNPAEDIVMMFGSRWGGLFSLGGLGGLPFTGTTGWKAMSSHVPENGNIVVLYAPHTGLDYQGKVG